MPPGGIPSIPIPIARFKSVDTTLLSRYSAVNCRRDILSSHHLANKQRDRIRGQATRQMLGGGPLVDHIRALTKASSFMSIKNLSLSRYSVTCPVCGSRFRPGKSSRMGIATFHCPDCDALLQYETTGMASLLLGVSLLAGPIISYSLGYREMAFVLVAISLSFLICILAISVAFHIHPPKVHQTTKDGGTELRLTDRPPR